MTEKIVAYKTLPDDVLASARHIVERAEWMKAGKWTASIVPAQCGIDVQGAPAQSADRDRGCASAPISAMIRAAVRVGACRTL